MVAELTGIPESASASKGSSRPKSLKSKIIGNLVGRRGCHGASSTSSSRVTSKNHREHGIPLNRGNSTRPRWIRNATREPIYSVLDDRETIGYRENRQVPSSRSGKSAKTLGYEISAVRHGEINRDTDNLPIYREDGKSVTIAAGNRQEIGTRCLPIDEESTSDNEPLPIYRENREECPIGVKNRQVIDASNRTSEEDSESEEYALYSVVRKPPKLVFPVAEASKLPILEEELEEESTREEKREEALKKQRELRKWLESATPREEFTEIGKEEKSVRRSMMSEGSPIERIDGKDAEFMSGGEKSDTDWSSPGGVSIPRGVIGMVGPFCRVYRNPNEQREYMLREEFQERGIDVGDDKVANLPADGATRIYEDRGNDEEEEEESLTIVDSVSDAGTFVDRNDEEAFKAIKKSATSIPDDESLLVVEEQRYRPRAKWRFSDEDDNAVTKKIDDTIDKSKIGRAWPTDRTDQPDLNSKDNYDLENPPKYTSKKSDASNEPHDKDSLNETGSTTGGTVEGNHSGHPGRGERNAGPSEPVPSTEGRPVTTNTAPPPKSLVSRILARARSSDNLLDHSEPYSQLWIVLSNVYGELVIVLMMALCLAEVMDTPVPLLSLQSVFLMYLYVGSIAVIISIYFWVLVDSCGSITGGRAEDAELGGGGASLTRFGSLKRAHISRARTAPTSFYIRVGALLFGLATLVFNGLEMAMHTMMQGAECLSDIIFVHPVLHGLFTFLQMHFLFVNSQVLVERFGLAARFGFTHLAATNIAVWARLVIWDSAQEWTYFVHLAQRGPETSSSPLNLRGFPGSLTRRARDLMGKSSSDGVVLQPYQPISPEQISQVVTLQECLNTNTLGQLWTSSMPFLYPFIVQFSLIAAAVTFVMGQNVGRNRYCHKQKFHSSKDLGIHSRVGCDGSSKGLFLGILCMTAGIVVILIFLVVREDDKFSPATLSWLTCGTLIGILTLSGVMTASGLVQVRQMSVVSRAPATLDALLSNVALFGVQLYAVFTAVVCACSLATHEVESQDPDSRGRHAMLLAASILQLAQCCAQSTLIAETSKRSCITRCQIMAKPARQVITFLLFSNAVLWAFDTVVTQNWVSQELQLRFFGVLAWGIVSRICLPLVVFYRFHSCVLLLEAWNKCYRIPRGEHPLN